MEGIPRKGSGTEEFVSQLRFVAFIKNWAFQSKVQCSIQQALQKGRPEAAWATWSDPLSAAAAAAARPQLL